MKYLLVAKFTIPESYVTGEFEPAGSDPLDEEVGSKDLFDEEDKVYGGGDDGLTVGASGEDRDPGEAVVGHEPFLRRRGRTRRSGYRSGGRIYSVGCGSPEGHLLVVRRASTQ